MIEISVIGNKGMNHKNKIGTIEVGASHAFADLLQQSGEGKETEGIDKVAGFTNPFLIVQNSLYQPTPTMGEHAQIKGEQVQIKGEQAKNHNPKPLTELDSTESDLELLLFVNTEAQVITQVEPTNVSLPKQVDLVQSQRMAATATIPNLGELGVHRQLEQLPATNPQQQNELSQVVQLITIPQQQNGLSQEGQLTIFKLEQVALGPNKHAQPIDPAVRSQNGQQGLSQTSTLNDAFVQQVTESNAQLREQMREQPGESSPGQQQEAGSLNDGSENPQVAGGSFLNRNTAFTPLQTMMDSTGKLVFETPVRVNQLDADISKLLQNAIDVQNIHDGIEATFSLQPAHLGKVDVKVSIQDGNLIAEFLTNSLSGKDLLESQVQVLRTALEQQGFLVEKISITQQQTNMSGAFSQKGDAQSRQSQHESKKRDNQHAYINDEDYWDYPADSGTVTRINTTA